jgi:hypothetical protein
MTGYVEWNALANVVVVGLVVGAGLPALFAFGVRALAGPGSRDDDGRRSPVRVAVAVVCFAIVVSAIAFAIAVIRAGHH